MPKNKKKQDERYLKRLSFAERRRQTYLRRMIIRDLDIVEV